MPYPIRFNQDGKLVRTREGKLSRSDHAGPCCCGKQPGVIPICGSESTCNKWCYPARRQEAKPECCDCPCEGRRCYPPGYLTTWSGIQLRTTRTFIGNYTLGPLSGGVYVTFGGNTALPAFNSCTDGATYTASVSLTCLIEIEDINTSTTYSIFNTDTSVTITQPNVACNSAPYTDVTTGSITVSLGSDTTFNDPGTTAFTNTTMASDLILETIENQSCCESGSVNPIQDPAVSQRPYVAFSSFGTVTYEPTCVDCDGDPLQSNTGDPAAICGRPTVAGELWDGIGSWLAFSELMDKTDICLFEAHPATPHAEIFIEPVDLTAAEAAGGCADETSCDGTIKWEMQIFYRGGLLRLRESGSCPPSGGWGTVFSDTLPESSPGVPGWRNIVLTYLGECKED